MQGAKPYFLLDRRVFAHGLITIVKIPSETIIKKEERVLFLFYDHWEAADVDAAGWDAVG